MYYSKRVKEAMQIAYKAHNRQVDKGGYPYIAHPLHLAEGCSSEAETIVALLHDVIEDAPSYYEEVKELVSEEELNALVLLTRKREDTYFTYIKKVSQNALATKIKCMDLEHNLLESRLSGNMPDSLKEKYEKAVKILKNKF